MHKNKDTLYYCCVCGLNQGFKPWGDNNDEPTFDICDCCGVQFGYQDCDILHIKKFRQEWIAKGANWFMPKYKPENWLLSEQIKNIPEEYL